MLDLGESRDSHPRLLRKLRHNPEVWEWNVWGLPWLFPLNSQSLETFGCSWGN